MNYLTEGFLLGFGSVLSPFSTTELETIVVEQSIDAEKLAGDWKNIGQDIYLAMEQIGNEQKEDKGY